MLIVIKASLLPIPSCLVISATSICHIASPSSAVASISYQLSSIDNCLVLLWGLMQSSRAVEAIILSRFLHTMWYQHRVEWMLVAPLQMHLRYQHQPRKDGSYCRGPQVVRMQTAAPRAMLKMSLRLTTQCSDAIDTEERAEEDRIGELFVLAASICCFLYFSLSSPPLFSSFSWLSLSSVSHDRSTVWDTVLWTRAVGVMPFLTC